jgi:hypothetical protein
VMEGSQFLRGSLRGATSEADEGLVTVFHAAGDGVMHTCGGLQLARRLCAYEDGDLMREER